MFKKENKNLLALLVFLNPFISTTLINLNLDILDKNEWYYNKNVYIFAILSIIGIPILMSILSIQMLVILAQHLNIKGINLYTSAYLWILSIIIPFIGWAYLTIMPLYLIISIIIKIKQSKLVQA